MNAKRYSRATITANNPESKRKYDRAMKLADETMRQMDRMVYHYSVLSDEERLRYTTLGNRYALLRAVSYATHADIVAGPSNKAESRRRSVRHYRAYMIGCIKTRHWQEFITTKFSDFWDNHIDETPAADRERIRERIDEERSRGN